MNKTTKVISALVLAIVISGCAGEPQVVAAANIDAAELACGNDAGGTREFRNPFLRARRIGGHSTTSGEEVLSCISKNE